MNHRHPDKIYARPVIPLLLPMISGIAVGTRFPGQAVWAYIGVFVCAGIIIRRIQQKDTGLVSPIVLFLALGYLSIQPWVAPEFPPNHVVHFTDTHPWKIIGVVDAPPAAYPNRIKFILRCETLGESNDSFPVLGNIRVTLAGGDGPKLSSGDRIIFISRIRSIKNFHNPGGFDYKRYMALKKVWGTAYVSGKKFAVLGRNNDKRVIRLMQDARRNISDLIEKSGSGRQQGVLKALIIGDRNAIEQDLQKAFNRAGIGHLLAISGLHIGIVAATAFLLFRWVLSHIQLFLWNAWTKKGAVVFSVIPVFVYGLLSGMSPSTQRAVIMVTIFLLAFLFESEYDPLNTLALAAMLILVVHPPSLFSISFQLSFVAVFAIIYGLSRVRILSEYPANKTKRHRLSKIIKKLLYFFLVSFFAILGTLPLTMLYFNQISLVGLLANVLIVPLVGFIVVPIGLLSVFLYPLTTTGALVGLKVGASVLTAALKIIIFFADLPFSAIKTTTPTAFEICCFYALLWALLNITYNPSKTAEEQDSEQGTAGTLMRLKHRSLRKTFQWRPATVVAILTLFLFGIDACYWLNKRFWQADLSVTMIDVGHGSSALLELPHGYNILIDGGGFSSNSVFDVGARIVAPLLWRKKIKTVDTLILSHPNSDHLNGLVYIAEHFNVKNVWSNNEPTKTFGYKKFMRMIQKNNINMPIYGKTPRTRDINGVHFEIFYPPENFLDKKKQERWRNTNNNSLVIQVKFGSISFLFPGDIKSRAEHELVSIIGNRLQSTVLLAPHHGSRTSSSELFLETVNPEVVVISSGWKKKFGFPHSPVLKRYKEANYHTLITALCGAVSLTTDGQSLTVRPFIVHHRVPFE